MLHVRGSEVNGSTFAVSVRLPLFVSLRTKVLTMPDWTESAWWFEANAPPTVSTTTVQPSLSITVEFAGPAFGPVKGYPLMLSTYVMLAELVISVPDNTPAFTVARIWKPTPCPPFNEASVYFTVCAPLNVTVPPPESAAAEL